MALELSDKTLVYWNMSSTYNGRPSQEKNLTTEKAITQVRNTLAILNPARPLAKQLYAFQEEIIVRPKRSKQTAKIVQLPSAKRASI